MKKTLKQLAFILALTMALTACGGKKTESPAQEAAPAETPAEEPAQEAAPEENPAEAPAQEAEETTANDNIGEAVSAEQENAAEAEVDLYEGQYTVEEVMIDDGGTNIYARIYKPVTEQETYPTCIMTHGIGGTYKNCDPYARQFAANGILTVAFDFQGGGLESQSDGKMVDMSTLTEAQDLEVVTEYVKGLDYVNAEQLFLLGESMGGFVDAYVAGNHPDDYAALVLFYPAFVLQDDARAKFPDGPETAPEVEVIYGMETGRQSYIDNLSFEIYDVIPGFTKDVLLVHGDADPVVPISYSERAVETYENAELKVIPGAEHGFRGEDVTTAGTYALEFVQAHIN